MKFALKLVVFILVLISFGCQSSSKTKKNMSVRINIKDEPQSLDPGKARQMNSQSVIHLLFDGLTRKGKNSQIELSVAERVDISPDLKSYTFYLKPTKWSNADPVTAHDFVYGWKRILSPDFPSDIASFLYDIKGAKAARLGLATQEEIGVRAVDERTLVVELEQPTPYFLELVAHPAFSPINQKVEESNEHWAQQDSVYVCNGPFKLDKWKHQDQIRLVKNSHYWDASCVQIDSLCLEMLSEETELNLFEKGELDWAGSPLSELPLEPLDQLKQKGTLHTQAALGTVFLRTNTQSPLLSNVKLRKALALSIDRESLVKHILQGGQQIATGLVPSFFGLNDGSYFRDADVKQAKELFEQACNEMQLSPERFSELSYLYRSSERNHLIAQAIQQQWFEAFGIRIKLESVEAKVFFSRVSKQDFQIAYGNWFGDFPDPINFLEVFKYKEGSNNTQWENKEYTSLLNQSNTVPSGKERQKLFSRAEKILIEEMPIIPLYYMNMLYVSQPWIKDVVLSPSGQIDFKWASIEDKR